MKTTALLLLCATMIFGVVGGLALADIEGSKHDFSNKDWAEGDSCGVCHAPHREEPPKAAPLWDPNADLSRRFLAPTTGKSTPGAGTMLCIRCHDGTVARDTISGVPSERYANKFNPGVFGTGHGATDHPVGIEYPKIDQGYRPTENVEASKAVRLPEGRVECISCHDPHDEAGVEPMLVMSNKRSALCLTCHNK